MPRTIEQPPIPDEIENIFARYYNYFGDIALTEGYIRAVEAGHIALRESVDLDIADKSRDQKTKRLKQKMTKERGLEFTPEIDTLFEAYLEQVITQLLPGVGRILSIGEPKTR